MKLTTDPGQSIKKDFEEQINLLTMAEEMLTDLDLQLMESGNDKEKISDLLALRSRVRKVFEQHTEKLSG